MAVQKAQSDTMADIDIGTPGGETLAQRNVQYIGTIVKATCTGILYANRVVSLSIPAFAGTPGQYDTWLATVQSEQADIVSDIDDVYGEGS